MNPAAGGACAPTTAARYPRAVPDHGDRLPVVGEQTRLRGHRILRRRVLPHRAVAARGCRLQRQAGRCHRHRVVRRSSRSRSSRSRPTSSSCSSARPPTRSPRATPRSTRTTRPASRPTTRASRARNSLMPNAFGSSFPRNEASALETGPQERTRAFEARWQRGGLGFMGAFGDLILEAKANDTAAEFVRAKIREIVHDPEVAQLLTPRQVIGCKRLCIDTGYYETFNRPNVRLVDVSDSPIEEITPTGVRHGGGEFELDCIVFATGFDAMTGALLAHRHPRPRRQITQRKVGRRTAHLSRPRRRGFPQPVHHHRAGQPLGAHQHDRVDRAARRLDRRLPRAPARAARLRHDRGHAARPKTIGSSTSTRSPTSRSSRRATRGTSAPTCPARPACSCRSSASRPTSRSATTSPPKGYEGSCSPAGSRPAGARPTTGGGATGEYSHVPRGGL